ncbi:MAG: YraN family protein [Planctomycetales bacterium]|nr:YraN family protein [Planctomycetales bacterium]
MTHDTPAMKRRELRKRIVPGWLVLVRMLQETLAKSRGLPDRWRRSLRRWLTRRRRRRAKEATLGAKGERLAARHLRRRCGMTIVGHGVRLGNGELDLLAIDGDVLVVVEVKTRRSHDAGHPAEAVDDRKQRQLSQLAWQFLRQEGLTECRWRIDIVAITWPLESPPVLEHFVAACEPLDPWD